MKRLLIILLCATALCSCLKEDSPESYTQRLYVDGRIEQGKPAEVVLTLNMGYDGVIDPDELRDMVVRWAKVTVSSSTESEVLTGRIESDYPSNFVYRGVDILGEEGESYTLTIEYSGRKWSARTTIPRPIEGVSMEREWTCDTMYRVMVSLPPTSEPCLMECSVGEGRYYHPALLGVLDASDESRVVALNRPLDYMNMEAFTPLFHRDDKLRLRVSSMPVFGYEYWSAWENVLINSLNPIFPSEHNPPTNISGDGRGLWCGYNSIYFKP